MKKIVFSWVLASLAVLGLPGYAQSGPSGAPTSKQSSTTSSSAPTSSSDSSAAPGQSQEATLLGFIHHVNHGEIEMAKLAKDNGSSSQVKQFAERMIKDHKNADDEVVAFAKNHNIDLGAKHDQMHAMHDQTQDRGEHAKDERQSRAVGTATGEYARTTEAPGTGGSGHMQAMAEHKTAMEKLRTLKGADFDREFAKAMVKDHQMVIDRLTSAKSRMNDREISSLVDKLLPALEEHQSLAQKLQDTISKS